MEQVICRYAIDRHEEAKAMSIRKRVFVEEQKLFQGSDIDEFDSKAIHLVADINGEIVGTVRLYREKENAWVGGRLAVLPEYRGRVGSNLVKRAVQEAEMQGATLFTAFVQKQNERFFNRLGWETVERDIIICGQEHVKMVRPLECSKFSGIKFAESAVSS